MRIPDCSVTKVWKRFVPAFAVMLALSLALPAEEVGRAVLQEPGPDAAEPAIDGERNYPLSELFDGRSEMVFRFGWWGTSPDGDRVKVGEYQDLEPSPFWDIDGIFSDGYQTLDFSMTGLDEEANQTRAYFFDSGFSVDFEYQRFFRRWDHDPLVGGPPTGTNQVVTEDLNVGKDYAIRVHELNADFQGRVSENVRWQLRLWGLRKFGSRQANATAHCFNVNFGTGPTDNRCHVLSQKQQIDWITMEIEPAVEATLGRWTLRYARTMRAFGTNDGFIWRDYNHFGAFGGRGTFEDNFPYAFVPDNFTQIDRVSIGGPVTEHNRFYGNLFVGNTRNQFRETDRAFQGFDLRLTNNSVDGLSVTLFGKLMNEDNDFPPFLLPEEDDPDAIRHPINYLRTRAGVSTRWQPFLDSCYDLDGFSIRSGYEFYEISRSFVRYEIEDRPDYVQPDTMSHQLDFAPTMRWSDELQTYVRYRARFIEHPLAFVHHESGIPNTRLPEFESLAQVGGTWTPVPNFLASAQVGVENRIHDSSVADFDEDDYPVVVTVWYAPSPKLSLSGGYALYTNWIDQDITLGFRDPGDPVQAETLSFGYGGRAAVVNFGGSYEWSEHVHFVGGVEWARGRNSFSVPASNAGADWSLLSDLSDEIIETMRYNAGFDVEVYTDVDCFFRYNFFDYEDKERSINSGTAHFFLAGVSASY